MQEGGREIDFAPFLPLDEIPALGFPTACLPSWLGDFAQAEAEATQTPPDLAGLLGVAAVSAAVAKKAHVAVRSGYGEPLNLFVCVALPPGSRKSQVFADVQGPLLAYEREGAAAARREVALAEERIQGMEARLGKLRAEYAKRGDDVVRQEEEELAAELADARAAAPVRPQLVTDDVTPETLAVLLERQGGRMALLAPEGGELFELARGRYAANARPNLGVLLKAHAGDTIAVDRKRERIFVEAPALTIAAAIQPSAMRALRSVSEFRDRGLLARFLYAVPRSLLGMRDWRSPPVPADVLQAYAENLRRLLELPLADATLGLEAQAFDAWLAFSEELEPRLGEEGDLAGLADWAGKLPGLVARLAGVLHAAEWADQASPWELPVERVTMERALELGGYALGHARAAFADMHADPRTKGALKIRDWIVRHERRAFTVGELWQAVKRGRFQSREDLDAPLGLLESHGYVAQVAPQGRNLRTVAYAVNPAALEREQAREGIGGIGGTSAGRGNGDG